MGVLEEVLDELKALRSEVAALNAAQPEQDELLDSAGAAALLGLTKSAVETMGKRGKRRAGSCRTGVVATASPSWSLGRRAVIADARGRDLLTLAHAAQGT